MNSFSLLIYHTRYCKRQLDILLEQVELNSTEYNLVSYNKLKHSQLYIAKIKPKYIENLIINGKRKLY